MTALSEMTEYMAKQLNDHESQQRGLEQRTYYSWTEPHLVESLTIAGSYLYALKPDIFAQEQCVKLDSDSCIINLKPDCDNVLRIIGVNGGCGNAYEADKKKKSLASLLKPRCVRQSHSDFDSFPYETLAEGIFSFQNTLRKGSTVTFLCASYIDINNVEDSFINEYKSFLINFALWQLLLTDNESRSNPLRWASYYQAATQFIALKFRTEFDLLEDQAYSHNNLQPK